jgi:hypothetical protein
MFRTLPTRAAAVSGKTIVIPSGDVTLLHATYAIKALTLRFVGKGDTYWELPTLELEVFDDTTAAGHWNAGEIHHIPMAC